VLAKKEAAKARADNPPAGGPLNLLPRTRTSSVRDFAFCPPERKSFGSAPHEARQSKSAVRIFVKKSSNINQKTPPSSSLLE